MKLAVAAESRAPFEPAAFAGGLCRWPLPEAFIEGPLARIRHCLRKQSPQPLQGESLSEET